MKKFFIIAIALMMGLSAIPHTTLALGAPPPLDYSGFVNCDGVLRPKADEPDRQRECNFAQLMLTAQKGIQWMFFIAVPIAGVLFAWGGLLYMSGKSGNIDKAKGIFTSVAIGFIIMITAWLIVRTVVKWFVKSDSTATIFLDATSK